MILSTNKPIFALGEKGNEDILPQEEATESKEYLDKRIYPCGNNVYAEKEYSLKLREVEVYYVRDKDRLLNDLIYNISEWQNKFNQKENIIVYSLKRYINTEHLGIIRDYKNAEEDFSFSVNSKFKKISYKYHSSIGKYLNTLKISYDKNLLSIKFYSSPDTYYNTIFNYMVEIMSVEIQRLKINISSSLSESDLNSIKFFMLSLPYGRNISLVVYSEGQESIVKRLGIDSIFPDITKLEFS